MSVTVISRFIRLSCLPEWVLALAAGALPVILRLALLPLSPIPVPGIAGEFSYLLAADTFAHGRLTNRPHPFWPFFESFHIIQQPTYMSMYPIGQGMVLALGKILFGHPWYGVCLSIMALGSSAYWALRAWLPKAWALAGGLFPGAAFGIGTCWGNGYWGGAVASAAGCLILGVAGRLIYRPGSIRAVNAVPMAIATLLLANSRPWEGVLLCSLVSLQLAGWFMFTKPHPRSTVFVRRFLLPFSIIFGAGLLFMAYYGWPTTGSPFDHPYLVNRRTYAVAPVLSFQKPRPAPRYRTHSTPQRRRTVRTAFVI
jgi:hypothetical protein